MNDIYPEEFRNRDDAQRDEEIAILRKALVTKRLTLYMVGVILALAVGGGVWLGWRSNITVNAVRHTQTQNSPIARDTHTLVVQQKDCLQKGGGCFEKNQAALVKILGSVRASNIEVTAAGASCAVTLTNAGQPIAFKPMFNCMRLTLAEVPHKRQ